MVTGTGVRMRVSRRADFRRLQRPIQLKMVLSAFRSVQTPCRCEIARLGYAPVKLTVSRRRIAKAARSQSCRCRTNRRQSRAGERSFQSSVGAAARFGRRGLADPQVPGQQLVWIARHQPVPASRRSPSCDRPSTILDEERPIAVVSSPIGRHGRDNLHRLRPSNEHHVSDDIRR